MASPDALTEYTRYPRDPKYREFAVTEGLVTLRKGYRSLCFVWPVVLVLSGQWMAWSPDIFALSWRNPDWAPVSIAIGAGMFFLTVLGFQRLLKGMGRSPAIGTLIAACLCLFLIASGHFLAGSRLGTEFIWLSLIAIAFGVRHLVRKRFAECGQPLGLLFGDEELRDGIEQLEKVEDRKLALIEVIA